jgi:hemerythrin
VQSFIQWRDEWLLDIDELDQEHMRLVSLVNQAASRHCCLDPVLARDSPGGVNGPVIRVLEELGEEVRRHFRNEERAMRRCEYPDYEAHRYEHINLLADYAELMREVHRQGAQCLDLATLESLKEWLISHMVGADRKFGDYYRESVLGLGPKEPDSFTRRWMRLSLNDQ